MNRLVRFADSLGTLQTKAIAMLKNKGFVGVQQAAEILDVAPNTVRAWGASGKLTEYRHPANNYRLYKLTDLEKFLEPVAPPKKHDNRSK